MGVQYLMCTVTLHRLTCLPGAAVPVTEGPLPLGKCWPHAEYNICARQSCKCQANIQLSWIQQTNCPNEIQIEKILLAKEGSKPRREYKMSIAFKQKTDKVLTNPLKQ